MEFTDLEGWVSPQRYFNRLISSLRFGSIFSFWFEGIKEEACDLFLLLIWGLFSPPDSEYVQSSNFISQVISGRCIIGPDQYTLSGVEGRIIERPEYRESLIGAMQINHTHYKFSGVLRFFLLQSLLEIEGRIIEPPDYTNLYSSLVSATWSSFTSSIKEIGPGKEEPNASFSWSKILGQAQQKAFSLLGLAGTHRFMNLSASCLTARPFYSPVDFSKEYRSMLRVSYNSNIGGFWNITSYSPLLVMDTSSSSPIAHGRLHQALSHHLLHCIFQFAHVVHVCPHWIEVCLRMDNVRCDVSPLNPIFRCDMDIIDGLLNERHFPAKICLTIGPENGFGVHSVSLTRSSQNPTTDIAKGNIYEATFEPPKNVGLKASTATTSTVKINNWGFEQSVVNCSDAKIEWTLYDSTTDKAVINNGPPKYSMLGPKTWSIDRYSRACRAFTAEGGVVFAKEEYGNPITWRLNRELEGQTVKWIVKGSVWVTYWPNTIRSRCSETKRHDFCQEFDLTLAQSSPSTIT
ncbi:hypothetical protein SUGI_1178730 [Cryptomeria japonica]|nr:hypothetical protein SUGI_1178730 [Cryptomeria japonica]